MTRRKLVVGNWKMNGSLAHVDAFCAEVAAAGQPSCALALCVPYVHLPRLVERGEAAGLAPGVQDVSAYREHGAYTGEVSAAMLAECGARYVVVGHSERRALHGESDRLVAAKADAAHAVGLIPIVCIGESLAQREADQTEQVLAAQVAALTDACARNTLEHIVLAYEPIWAIGTGRSATPAQAQDVHAFVRGQLGEWDATIADSLPIVYGGSVKPDNAAELFAGADVDGALVGGASLKAESFLAIARALD